MKKLIVSISLVCVFLSSGAVFPCTTFFLPQSAGKIVAKNMDWPYGQGLVYINKRHVLKRSAFIYSPQQALVWTSKYMSVTFSQTGREFPWEGMNEAGLSVNLMQLMGSVPPPASDLRPAVNILQWIQFILDTSSTVDEAVGNARRVKVSGPMVTTLHFMVCDRGGHCAVFENLGGQLVIHQGTNLPFLALTNDTYDDSVDYLQNELRMESPADILSSDSPKSLDRFARAAVWSSMFKPQDDAVAYAFAGLQNVHQPKFTQWSMVFSLEPRTVEFRTLHSPAIKGIKLADFNPSCRTPVMIYDMNGAAAGDVTGQFVNYTFQANATLASESLFDPRIVPLLESYPATTKCME